MAKKPAAPPTRSPQITTRANIQKLDLHLGPVAPVPGSRLKTPPKPKGKS